MFYASRNHVKGKVREQKQGGKFMYSLTFWTYFSLTAWTLTYLLMVDFICKGKLKWSSCRNEF